MPALPARVDAILAVQGSSTRGEALYRSNCSSCHGADGESGSARRDVVAEAASNGGGAVRRVLAGEDERPSFDSLSDQANADLLAYLRPMT